MTFHSSSLRCSCHTCDIYRLCKTNQTVSCLLSIVIYFFNFTVCLPRYLLFLLLFPPSWSFKSLWYHFLFIWRTACSNSFRAGLLATNSLPLFFSHENVFIFAFIPGGYLHISRIPGLLFFPSSTLKVQCGFLLASMVSDEKFMAVTFPFFYL